MKKAVLVTLSAALLVSLMALKPQTHPAEEAKIKWVTLEEAYKLNQKQPRKVFIDLYTDWCGWCKVMDKNTFKNAEVIDFVNKKYYAVKFNPEKDGDVMLGKVSFKNMLNGKVTGYPTTVFMNEKMALIQPVSGTWSRVCFIRCWRILEIITTKKSLLTNLKKKRILENTQRKHSNYHRIPLLFVVFALT